MALDTARPKPSRFRHTGYYYSTSGLEPKDTTLPTDPHERAVAGCERNAKVAVQAVRGERLRRLEQGAAGRGQKP